jgi:hypothetical protein
MDGVDTARPGSFRVAWAPQPGPQTYLLTCPIEDVLFGGARGGGKSDGLLGDWLSHSGRWGKHAAGIVFRRSVPSLEELWKRSNQLFPLVGSRWRAKDSTWIMRNGSTLKFRWLDRDQDADNYQGHQYTWIGADELGTWGTPDPIDKLRATLRSPYGIPCVMRATANPGGIGHNWLKERYIHPAKPMTPFFDENRRVHRVFIPSKLQQNLVLMQNDPGYLDRLRSSGPEWLVRAWLEGDWDASAGDSFFTEEILKAKGLPVPWPVTCDAVFAIVDTAVKTGKERDGTAVTYYGLTLFPQPSKLVILDYDIAQIEGALLINWLPGIQMRLEQLAANARARRGSAGILIEDKNSGSVLIQQAIRLGMRVKAIDSKLSTMGKDERALLAAPYVYGHHVKVSEFAWNKTVLYKGYTKNHWRSQVTGYRLGVKDQEDDLLDTFTYGVIVTFGDFSGVK